MEQGQAHAKNMFIMLKKKIENINKGHCCINGVWLADIMDKLGMLIYV